MTMESDYKLFTAEIKLGFYYSQQNSVQIINIVASTLNEAVLVAQEYVKEHHCSIIAINNDCENIYTLAEIEKIGGANASHD